MKLETVENIIRKFQQYNDKIAHFTWIGGEPLLMPDSFWEYIAQFSNGNNPKGLSISHSIQTNGSRLNDERKILLQSLGFKIGVSYDGDIILQNQLRVNRRRNLTTVTTDNLIKILESSNKTIGIISVVTKLSYGKELIIYNGLKEKTKAANLNFFSPIGEGKENIEHLLPNRQEAKEMMILFYKLWRDDTAHFQLNPFADIVRSFYTGRNRSCEYSTISCYRIVGIDAEGKVYTCSRSTHLPKTFMGNINNERLEDILQSEPHRLILERYSILKKEGCKYLSICSGGCPVEALEHKGNFVEKSYYCCDVKGALFDKITEDLKNETIRKNFESRLSI